MLKVCLPDFSIKQSSGTPDLKYVVHGAPVECSCGSASSSLVIPDRGYITGLELNAMDVDTAPSNFSSPFGICKITKLPCTLPLLPKWIEVDVRQNVCEDKMHPLLKKSLLVCFMGGIVSISDNGQKSMPSSTKLLEDNYRADE